MTADFLELSPQHMQIINANESSRTPPNTLAEEEGLHLFNVHKYINRIINQFQIAHVPIPAVIAEAEQEAIITEAEQEVVITEAEQEVVITEAEQEAVQ